MSLNPFALASFPHYQLLSNPPIPPYNSTVMSVPLAQKFCGMLPSTTPSYAPSLRQPFSDDIFTLPVLQPKNPSKQDSGDLQSLLGSSSPLPSKFQHQAQCLQASRKTIRQFHQHLQIEQLDRKILHTIVLQLEKDFALLGYLLFLSIRESPISDTLVKNSAVSSPIISNLEPKPNPNPIPTELPFPGTDEASARRSTPKAAVGQEEQGN